MAEEKKKDSCPWCSGCIGKEYEKLKKDWLKITTYEKGEHKKYKDMDLPQNVEDILVVLGMGNKILDSGGHPWIPYCGVVSNSDIHRLESKKFIKREFVHFDKKRGGLRWKITPKGQQYLKDRNSEES